MVRSFEELIEKNYKKEQSPSAYADMMNITTKHLNRICRTSLNKTATEVITERSILEAKRMLAQSSSTVMQISDELGYDDNSYFSRLFKKHVGQTPTEFRQAIKENNP
jgi:AraC-like DNA-binding protein